MSYRRILREDRIQLLESINALLPHTDSLEEHVSSWTFLPLEFNLAGKKLVEAQNKPSTTESYKALTELIARDNTGSVIFGKPWLQDDVDYLKILLSDKITTPEVRGEFTKEAKTEDLLFQKIMDEVSATPFIETQLKGFLTSVYRAYRKPEKDPYSALDMGVRPRLQGPGRTTVIADVVISRETFTDDQPESESLELVKGEYKVPSVLTYAVLVWMIYLARKGYHPDPDMPDDDDVCQEEKVARRALNQAFMQQVTSPGTRSFLSNGRHFIFFKVGETRTDMIMSSIYNPDGTVDPYDGILKPDEWPGKDTPLNALRSTQLGHAQPHMLMATVMASLRDLLHDNSPSLQLDDDDDDPPCVGGSSTDRGSDGEGGVGGAGKDNKTDSDNVRDRQPSTDLEKSEYSQGDCRSKRLAGQSRTPRYQAPPLTSQFCTQDKDTRLVEPDSAIQLVPVPFATSNAALVTMRRPAALKGWHRFGNAMFDKPVHKVQDLIIAYPTPPVSLDHILLKRFISTGTLGDVFSGSLTLPRPQHVCHRGGSYGDNVVTAAFKVMSTSTFAAKHWRWPQDRPFTEQGALDAFDMETSMLKRVNSQSLGVVPLFFGMWEGEDRHGYQHRLIAMELLGEEAHQNMSLEDKELVVACLSKLHSLGLRHGDIALRHFKRRPTSQSSPWAMIDLERSKERAATDVDFKAAKREMAELRRLLQL